jgi:hypothetical protein
VNFAKPAPNTIVRSFNHRTSGVVAAYDLFGAKRTADTAGFTPVPKDCLIIQFLDLPGLLLFGCPGFIGNHSLLGGLFGPFFRGIHGLYLNGIAFAGLSKGLCMLILISNAP